MFSKYSYYTLTCPYRMMSSRDGELVKKTNILQKVSEYLYKKNVRQTAK